MVSLLDLLTACFQPNVAKSSTSMPAFKLSPPPLRKNKIEEDDDSGGNAMTPTKGYVVVGAVKANTVEPTIGIEGTREGIETRHIRSASEMAKVESVGAACTANAEPTAITATPEPSTEHCDPITTEPKVIVQEHVNQDHPLALTLQEALASAHSDPLYTNLSPPLRLLYNNRGRKCTPRQCNYDHLLKELKPLFTDNAEMAERLVGCWVRVAERRVGRGLVVSHLVDYFEDAILQQYL